MTVLSVQPNTDTDDRDPVFRVSRLVDPASVTALPGNDNHGVFVARGRIDGAPVIVFCTDGTTMGGALGLAGAQRVVEAVDTAIRDRIPIVGIWHSGGARLADGVESMHGVGLMFAAMTRASGRIPQISVVVGPAAGAAAYGPALTDVVLMAPEGRMFITGPEVVRSVTGEEIDMAGLGGAEAHGKRSGVVHITTESEADAYTKARLITGFYTKPGLYDLGKATDDRDPSQALPESARRAYDVRPLISSLVDVESEFVELQQKWAPNMVIGFGRLTGRAIGVIANNPLRKGGCLDSLSAEKASRFVRMCDAFGLPLVVIVDVPGYVPGVGQEWGGVVRRGSKLLYAFAEATVPRVTLITRKSYGGAYIAMNSRSLGATRVLAWPGAEVAIMGAEAAVEILYRKKLAAAPEAERAALRAEFTAEQRRVAGGVDRAMALGVLDEVVHPAQTRHRLASVLAAAPAGRGHHGNVPL